MASMGGQSGGLITSRKRQSGVCGQYWRGQSNAHVQYCKLVSKLYPVLEVSQEVIASTGGKSEGQTSRGGPSGGQVSTRVQSEGHGEYKRSFSRSWLGCQPGSHGQYRPSLIR